MTSWIKTITILSAAATLFACSNGNSDAPLVDSAGKHPDKWLETHWVAYKSAQAKGAAKSAGAATFDSPCIECHGNDLSGGIAKVGCFSAIAPDGRTCHANKLGHPDNWSSPEQHGSHATLGALAAPGISSGLAYCARCHGDDYKGGAGKAVSCFSCHSTAPHPPKPWHDNSAAGASHTKASTGNAAECAKCHLSPSAGTTAPGCFNNTMCHGTPDQIGHGSGWLLPASAGFHSKNLNNSCAACHGSELKGSGSAPSCMSAVPIDGLTCHASAPPTSAPAVENQCKSCHGNTTAGPDSIQAPNRQLRHGKHLALRDLNSAVSAANCVLCHAGGGSGTANHAKASSNGGYAAASVGLSGSFGLAGATPSYDPVNKSCAGVSCHGGQSTPSWESGSFDTYASTSCRLCHESGANNAQAPYNSYKSGKQSTLFAGRNLHDFHLQGGASTPAIATCTECHSTARLRPVHFIGLDAQNLNLRTAGKTAADTIGGQGSSVIEYDKANQGSCSSTCHDTRTWY